MQTLAAATRGSLDADELHVEHQRRAGRNDAAGAAVAVGEVRRDDEAALPADLHAGDALIPSLDHLTARPAGSGTAYRSFSELSNSLPLLIRRRGSYSQPVYCTTAYCPAATASPVPRLRSVDLEALHRTRSRRGAPRGLALQPGSAPVDRASDRRREKKPRESCHARMVMDFGSREAQPARRAV